MFQTTTAPNAWAIVAQWRRYFEMKGEVAEEEEKVEELISAFETQLAMNERLGESVLSPIEDPGVVEARKYFAMEYYRNLINGSSALDGHRGAAPAAEEQLPYVDRNAEAERIISSPDLRVPAGDAFMYIPQ